ncbi:hypothetical protein Scep_022254 [Stephania cephalantha]|uniref:Uncharacterized protein n=1 Tax=Stephania cephalantha TaxID=152367 RepID=A0AAP0F7L3_9MAGN
MALTLNCNIKDREIQKEGIETEVMETIMGKLPLEYFLLDHCTFIETNLVWVIRKSIHRTEDYKLLIFFVPESKHTGKHSPVCRQTLSVLECATIESRLNRKRMQPGYLGLVFPQTHITAVVVVLWIRDEESKKKGNGVDLKIKVEPGALIYPAPSAGIGNFFSSSTQSTKPNFRQEREIPFPHSAKNLINKSLETVKVTIFIHQA